MIPIFSNQKLQLLVSCTENVTLIMRGQIKTPDGSTLPFSETYTLTGVTSGTVSIFTKKKINLPIGELLTYSTSMTTASIQRGQCFVQSMITNSDDLTEVNICAGYVSSGKGISLGFFEDSLSGRGFIGQIITGAITPAGGMYTLQGSDYLFRRLISVSMVFQLSADVGTRVPMFRLTNVGGTAAQIIYNGAFVAADTAMIFFALNNDIYNVYSPQDGMVEYFVNIPNDLYLRDSSESFQVIMSSEDGPVGDEFNVSIRTEDWIIA
jgi:hypothetical protein